MQRNSQKHMALSLNYLQLALALNRVMQPDEAEANEPTTDRNERFRVQVFNVCMDTVIAQLSDRFAEDKIPLRHRCNPVAEPGIGGPGGRPPIGLAECSVVSRKIF
jgi:hypothetical protein